MTVSNNNTDSGDTSDRTDEELARALQEQYRNEALQFANESRQRLERYAGSWSHIQSVVAASSSGVEVSASGSTPTAADAGSARLPSASAPPMRSSSNTNTSQPTPKFDKKMQDELYTPDTVATEASTPSPDHQHARKYSQPPKRSSTSTTLGTTAISSSTSPRTSPRNSPRGSPRGGSPRNGLSNMSEMYIFDMDQETTADDEILARRLDRELRDAELASKLERAERASAAQLASADFDVVGGSSTGTRRRESFAESPSNPRGAASRGGGPPSGCGGKTLYYTLRIGLAAIVCGIAFLVYITVFGGNTSDALDPATWLPGYPEKDPSLGSVGENSRWRPLNRDDVGTGLTLTVLNNLEAGSDWNEYFEKVIYEWNNGTPDAVNLNIRKMTDDPDCRAVRRAMKVCNANYGPTDWRGVNQILLQDDYIITSLAKMNDYYLEGTNRAQKQYTMCHEIGHGLGLGHTDENFHNYDLGNCMDYTERPENNMHPDESNFETLEELYGNVNGVVRVKNMLQSGGGRRMKEERLSDEEFEKYSASLLDPIDISSHFKEGWRLLLKTDTAEFHERRLGNGYTIRTSVLLA